MHPRHGALPVLNVPVRVTPRPPTVQAWVCYAVRLIN